ncbi:MAG: radical SAM protein [Nitrososphaerales archaeon]|nr:radical SAM protein [Nitrososphaerales archaeon]
MRRRKTAVFALLSTCNCRCIMCDMWKLKREHISLQGAKEALNFLRDNGFLVVYFTGGEPTLHPDLIEIVNYANKLGFVTSVTTNGTCSKGVIYGLREAGLYLLSVSLDHWDDEVCDKIRGVKGIKQKEEEVIRYAKDAGLKVYALTYLNPHIVGDGVEVLVKYVNRELKVPFGFCYPTYCDDGSYHLGGDLSGKELHEYVNDSVKSIYETKKKGASVANPFLYIEDVIRFNNKEVPNYYCKGGEEVVYVDWKGDVYPCFLKPKLFNMLTGDKPRFLKKVKCNECLINCFREPSLFPQALKSPKLVSREVIHSWNDTVKLILPKVPRHFKKA